MPLDWNQYGQMAEQAANGSAPMYASCVGQHCLWPRLYRPADGNIGGFANSKLQARMHDPRADLGAWPRNDKVQREFKDEKRR
jgi:hypothetical protein